MLRYVALKCYDRLAGACKCWANNVGICCVEMLLSFGRGLIIIPRARARYELVSIAKELAFVFSNSLITHEFKRKKITSVKEVWIPVLN